MKRLIIVVAIFTAITFASCDHQEKNQITGTWERVEEKRADPQIQIGISNNEPIEVLLMFKEDGTIKVKQGPQSYDAQYQLSLKELTLGNRKYELLKLDSDSLIMKEISDWESLASTYKYFKTEKRIKEE
ncbi:hypothetical protein [Carboxylicivirga marina]|uniref:Lipocalin-like domain-containing protein n=1 Tax=Carboxylicivirga marina TaxID=2800988 RepID=A0ABS1HMF5_9BACT|nr:hypothetical protein [Carboxylicivirga marina]MBK3518864.1 hypothetical protein [Carboxylicivirga marina]